MGRTSIEWTDLTVNPGIYGCAEESPACANCYAAKMAHRLAAAGVYPTGITAKRASGVHWSGRVVVDGVAKLSQNMVRQLPKKKPGRVFVTSMSDVGLDEVDDDFLTRLFGVFALHPHLTFQVLTKRPQRLLRWFETWKVDEAVASDGEHHARTYMGLDAFSWDGRGPNPEKYGVWLDGEQARKLRQRRAWPGWPLPNVWIGATVEDQKRADERIPLLVQIPARVRFLSCEPLLGPIDLAEACEITDDECHPPIWPIHWVIAGGESGSKARPTHPAWFRSLRDQCVAAGVPWFFKQWGEWAPRSACAGWTKEGRTETGEGISWLADGRICLRDFSVVELRERMRTGASRSTRAVEVDEGALADLHAAWDSAEKIPPEEDLPAGWDLGYQWMYRVGKERAGRELDGRTWDEVPRV